VSEEETDQGTCGPKGGSRFIDLGQQSYRSMADARAFCLAKLKPVDHSVIP
jgi:hypothetical protein